MKNCLFRNLLDTPITILGFEGKWFDNYGSLWALLFFKRKNFIH